MASGWAKDGAIQSQIDDGIFDAVTKVREGLSLEESALFCEECEELIPESRRNALKGIKLCIACQRRREEMTQRLDTFNRRASKK